MAYNSDEIRGVMIQVGDDRLLLPNATVAEVLAKVPVEPVEDAPDWLPGRIDWHGWQVPVKFATLAGLQEDAAGRGNRVIVLKALGGDEALPYFGLLTASFPQLVSVPRDSLPALPAGEYYWHDLIDLPVVDEAGAAVGTVVSVENYGASDVLEIALEGGRRVLLPLVPDAVREIGEKLCVSRAWIDAA